MRIYTKTGDAGETGLFGGARVRKDDPRVEACGTLDELNAVLGLVRSLEGLDVAIDAGLARVQGELFALGAELSTDPAKSDRVAVPLLGEAEVGWLETAIDASETELPPLTQFILPGGSPAAAALHHARTVCRRAERRVVTLQHEARVRGEVGRYVNRLSDLLFSWARLANLRANVPDVPWNTGVGSSA